MIITAICGTILGVQKVRLNNLERGSDDLLGLTLGLDLQGGSYLLLEIDNQPVITQRLQNTLPSIRKYLKNKKISYINYLPVWNFLLILLILFSFLLLPFVETISPSSKKKSEIFIAWDKSPPGLFLKSKIYPTNSLFFST